jgi:hypothetical protein
VFNFSQQMPPGVGWSSRCRHQRRIFSVNPAQKRGPLFGVRTNQIDPLRGGRKRNGWRIDNLEKIKTGGMRRERRDEKTSYGDIATTRCIPIE